MKPALELLRELRANAISSEFLSGVDETSTSSTEDHLVEPSEQIAAVLLRSADYGDVWLVRDDEAAAELIAELERGARPIPVITFDEVALLRGESAKMLQAVLTAKAALPGSRLLQ